MRLLSVELTLDILGLRLKIGSYTVHILLIRVLVDCRQEVWRRRSTCTRSWWSENSAPARPPSSRDTSTSFSPSTTELPYPYLRHTYNKIIVACQLLTLLALCSGHVTGPASQSLNLASLFVSQSYHCILLSFRTLYIKINFLWKQIILRKISSLVFSYTVYQYFFFKSFYQGNSTIIKGD